MATIQSLPTELIRHTLSLAYPPGLSGSKSGLCKTALVHSCWREPSVSVMTEHITLKYEGCQSFTANGPSNLVCRTLDLKTSRAEDIRSVVGKVAPVSVKKFLVSVGNEGFPVGLFELAALSGEHVPPSLHGFAEWYN